MWICPIFQVTSVNAATFKICCQRKSVSLGCDLAEIANQGGGRGSLLAPHARRRHITQPFGRVWQKQLNEHANRLPRFNWFVCCSVPGEYMQNGFSIKSRPNLLPGMQIRETSATPRLPLAAFHSPPLPPRSPALRINHALQCDYAKTALISMKKRSVLHQSTAGPR